VHRNTVCVVRQATIFAEIHSDRGASATWRGTVVHWEGAHDPRRTAFGTHRTMSSLMRERDGNLTPHPAGEIGEGRERYQAPVREFLSFGEKHSWSKPNGIQRPVWARRCRTRRARVSRTPVGHLHPSVLSERTCEPPCIGWLAFVPASARRGSCGKQAPCTSLQG